MPHREFPEELYQLHDASLVCQDLQGTNENSTYEIINPADFGLGRYVHFAHRLTGWNAIKSRVEQLGLHMSDTQVKLL